MRISRIIDSERGTRQTKLNKFISAEHPCFQKRPFGGSWNKTRGEGDGEGDPQPRPRFHSCRGASKRYVRFGAESEPNVERAGLNVERAGFWEIKIEKKSRRRKRRRWREHPRPPTTLRWINAKLQCSQQEKFKEGRKMIGERESSRWCQKTETVLGNLYSKVYASMVIAYRNTTITGQNKSMAMWRPQNLKNVQTGKQRLCTVCVLSDLAGLWQLSDFAVTIELHIIL